MEHDRFVEGLEKFGRRKWIRIAQHVGTRTVIQVRSHAQKYFKKLGKDDTRKDGFALLAAAAQILEDKNSRPLQPLPPLPQPTLTDLPKILYLPPLRPLPPLFPMPMQMPSQTPLLPNDQRPPNFDIPPLKRPRVVC